MLIYSKERLVPPHINMIVLQGASNEYYYVHRSLYDQAVILEDRYKDNPEAIIRGLGKDPEEYSSSNIELFIKEAPRPLNMLGYFLLLIDDIQSTVEPIEVLCGAIHVMSSLINFRDFLKFPREMRAKISFSLSIREEYEVSWDRFFREATVYGSEPVLQRTTYGATTYKAPEMQLTLETAETEDDFLALLDEDFEIDLSVPEDIVSELEVEPEPPKIKEKSTSALSRLRGM